MSPTRLFVRFLRRLTLVQTQTKKMRDGNPIAKASPRQARQEQRDGTPVPPSPSHRRSMLSAHKAKDGAAKHTPRAVRAAKRDKRRTKPQAGPPQKSPLLIREWCYASFVDEGRALTGGAGGHRAGGGAGARAGGGGGSAGSSSNGDLPSPAVPFNTKHASSLTRSQKGW